MAATPLADPRTVLDEVSYIAPPGITYEQWREVGERFQLYTRASNWWLGDWLLYGDRRFGEDRVSNAVDLSGLEYSTVTACRWVASKITPEDRRPGVSWSHHREVAALPPVEQRRLLEIAEADGMTRDEFRTFVGDEKRRFDEKFSGSATGIAEPEETSEDPATSSSTSAGPTLDPPLASVRSITEGYDDSSDFSEACNLRYGETKGPEIHAFVVAWLRKHHPKLADRL